MTILFVQLEVQKLKKQKGIFKKELLLLFLIKCTWLLLILEKYMSALLHVRYHCSQHTHTRRDLYCSMVYWIPSSIGNYLVLVHIHVLISILTMHIDYVDGVFEWSLYMHVSPLHVVSLYFKASPLSCLSMVLALFWLALLFKTL